jgi:excinuclease ABC subunit A
MKKIEMSFLPDVSVPCEVCGGKRFNRETLEVTYRGKNISQVLDMNVEEAEVFFQSLPAIHRPLQLLKEIGLGYLTLGQQSPSLSGGEAQRIKLVSELAGTSPEGRRGGGTLYILDEPTIGLHMADVSKLTGLLHRLVSAGNSSIVIEHNLDLIAAADWIIDLGPEGGEKGGWIVAQGSPTEIAARPEQSHTAAVLKAFLENRNKTG